MTNLVDTFVDRFHEWAVALGQHIQLSLVTLLVAIIISIPAAILLSQHKKGQHSCSNLLVFYKRFLL